MVLGLALRLVSVNTSEPLIAPATVGAKLIGNVQRAPVAGVFGLPVVGGQVPLPVLSLCNVRRDTRIVPAHRSGEGKRGVAAVGHSHQKR